MYGEEFAAIHESTAKGIACTDPRSNLYVGFQEADES